MNDSESYDALKARVEQLEKTVAELKGFLRGTQDDKKTLVPKKPPLPTQPDSAAQSPSRPAALPRLDQTEKTKPRVSNTLGQSEFWLNKIGIALLLFGLVFLFKYAVDQGWLTPVVRIAFGVVLGLVLVVVGARLHERKRHFACVLMGGGIATFYITGFAAFQVFDLVGHTPAFVFMIVVTLLTFALSVYYNESIMALIATLGGMATPFLLYTGTGSVAGLMGYSTCVLLGAGAIYFFRRWRGLLWVAFAGGILVAAFGLNALPANSGDAIQDRWALQWGLIFIGLIFGGMPLIREVLSLKQPDKWGVTALQAESDPNKLVLADLLIRHLHPLCLLTPILVLNMSMSIWTLADAIWGWIALGLALIYGLAAWRLSGFDAMMKLGQTLALVSAIMATTMIALFFTGNLHLLGWAVEVVALLWLAQRLTISRLEVYAHLQFVAIAIWLIQRLFAGDAAGTAFFNLQAATDLVVLALVTYASFLFASPEGRKVYRLFAHVAFLGWLQRELSVLPNGQGYVTISWGIYAVSLLVWGLRQDIKDLRTLAIVTLMAVVAKLFLVDLAQLETLWRVLLFLGFGGLFLILSYYFQNIWKASKTASS